MIISPAVGFIEMAADQLKAQQAWLIASESKEFHALGAERKAAIVAAAGGDPMLAGYLLGLETGRVIVRQIPGTNGVSF